MKVHEFDISELSGSIDHSLDKGLRCRGDAVNEDPVAGFQGFDRFGSKERTFHILRILYSGPRGRDR